MGFDISDLDPTNPNNFTYDVLPFALPGIGSAIQAKGARNAAENDKERAEAEARERQAYYDEIAQQYAGVRDLDETAERQQTLYRDANVGITQGEMDSGNQLARAYDQRGLGASGYAATAQATNTNRAAAERASQQLAAWNQAVAEGQQSLMGQANISKAGDPFLMQMLQSAEQAYRDALAMSWEQQDNLTQAGMQVAGYAMGGPAGAQAAGQAYGDSGNQYR